jgi:hypothetical protein
MLSVEKQRTFIRLAASAPVGASARSLAKAAGFTPDYGPRLLRRHKDAIDRRRRNLENLSKARPKHKVGTGEMLRLLEERRDLHLIDPAFALRQWYLARDEYFAVDLRWRTPSQMDTLRAQRELTKARHDFERITETAVRVHEVHGKPVPTDLLAKPERSRTAGTATPKTVVDDAASEGASPGAEPCRLHPSQPAKGCQLCPMAPKRCPRHGLVYEPVIIHGPRGPVGQRLACPECEPSTTTYATERSRQLAWTMPERVIASTGPGRTASSYAPRTYGDSFDPSGISRPMTINELVPPVETRVAGDPAPDPGAAQERIAAFEAEHADALADGNHVGHRSAVRERSRLYSAAYGSDPATGLDVGSGDVEPLQPGDHAGAIERSIRRELGPVEYDGIGEFAAELASAGVQPAEAAFLVPEVARSSPVSDAELLARVSRDDLRAAAAFFAANPALDELAADFTHHPVVLRWAADKWRNSK